MTQNIFAPITSILKSSTIVIRVSGVDILQDFIKIFKIKNLQKIEPRKSYLVNLWDQDGEVLDNCLFCYFQTPNSYTGEDVIEISLHGSIYIYKEVIKILANSKKFRFAENGEFTKRAFLNKKIDLFQAEAIDDLIKSETKAQANLAQKFLSKKVSNNFNGFREKIILSRAFFEAYIDFPEEDIPKKKLIEAKDIINEIAVFLKNSLKNQEIGERIREGIRVAIIGEPNSGKSSLLNHLAKRDIAIISDIAGTTRDLLEVHLDIAGFPIILNDSAGIRETEDEIEKIGIVRAEESAKKADFRILLFSYENINNLKKYQKFIDDKTIIVCNKIDLLPKDINIEKNILQISVKEEKNIDKLITKLKENIIEKYSNFNDVVIDRKRHRKIIIDILANIKKIDFFNDDIEIIAEYLRLITNDFARLTGHIDIEDILDKIFLSFCIGK